MPFPLMKLFVYENQCYTNAHVLCFLLIILQWFNEINDPCNGPKTTNLHLLPILASTTTMFTIFVQKWCEHIDLGNQLFN